MCLKSKVLHSHRDAAVKIAHACISHRAHFSAMVFTMNHIAIQEAAAKKQRTHVDLDKLVFTEVAQGPVPQTVRSKLSSPDGIFMGIDVETHAFVKGNIDFHDGDFGFQRKVDPANFNNLKVVQVAWAIAKGSAPEPIIKSRFVKPEGFVITPEATSAHKITQKYATIHGLPLGVVMREMFADVKEAHDKGGRICAHQLEFDAGMLAAEMSSLGFTDMLSEWKSIVRSGICTMDPDMASWLRCMAGGDYIPKYVPIKLVDALKILAPEQIDLIKDHHNAAVDCHMHWIVARALCQRASA